MIECVRKALAKILRETADKFDAGTTDIDEEQTIEIMKIVAHQPMSKESAALYLNMSTSRFDTLVRDGYLPKGRKRIGFKEKVWYQDEFLNTIVHEAKHVQSHICKYYGVEEDTEKASYLIGYIVQKMHRVFRYIISTGTV